MRSFFSPLHACWISASVIKTSQLNKKKEVEGGKVLSQPFDGDQVWLGEIEESIQKLKAHCTLDHEMKFIVEFVRDPKPEILVDLDDQIT